MNEKIQLQHPAGKKAVKIDTDKYIVIKNAIIKSLKKKVELTHTELLDSVVDVLAKSKADFEGAVGWYMESVKLDLEATKIIERLFEKPPHKWKLL
jgi:hypothetical protein